MKNETVDAAIKGFVGFKPKMYSFLVVSMRKQRV